MRVSAVSDDLILFGSIYVASSLIPSGVVVLVLGVYGRKTIA